MRADAVAIFEFQRMINQAHHLEFPIVEAEQRADAHVVNSGVKGAVHTIQPPAIISFNRARRMHETVCLLVIGFLKDLIRADARFMQALQVFNRKRRGVDVHAPDRAFALARRPARPVNRLQRRDHVIHVRRRMLAEHDNQAFMADFSGQDADFMVDFLLRQHVARHARIRRAEAAIEAIVDAGGAEIERRERDDAIVIDMPLDVAARDRHFMPQFGVCDVQQRGGFVRRQILDSAGFGENVTHPRRVRPPVRPDFFLDFGVWNKILPIDEIFVNLLLLDAALQPWLMLCCLHGKK